MHPHLQSLRARRSQCERHATQVGHRECDVQRVADPRAAPLRVIFAERDRLLRHVLERSGIEQRFQERIRAIFGTQEILGRRHVDPAVVQGIGRRSVAAGRCGHGRKVVAQRRSKRRSGQRAGRRAAYRLDEDVVRWCREVACFLRLLKGIERFDDKVERTGDISAGRNAACERQAQDKPGMRDILVGIHILPSIKNRSERLPNSIARFRINVCTTINMRIVALVRRLHDANLIKVEHDLDGIRQ